MATSIAFMKLTDQGVRGYRETVDRFEQARELAGKFGVEIKQIYWTPGGPYDIISVAEGEGKNTSAFGIALEALGNLRITFADAYGREEMREVIATGG